MSTHGPRKDARDRLALRVFVPLGPFGSWEKGFSRLCSILLLYHWYPVPGICVEKFDKKQEISNFLKIKWPWFVLHAW